MKKETQRTLTPRLRFSEFRKPWQVEAIGDYLVESRIPGSDGLVAKKITVKLWGKGVYEKVESLKGSENTQYYKRRAGQFIYSKLDFLNQAFGIIPETLDGFESTVDLPCFDVSDELDARFLVEYVQRPSFFKKHGDMADGGRKAKRIQVESFLSFPVAVPSPAEQRKIAACLGSLDDRIAAESAKLEALRSHKKGLMEHLFPRPGESRPPLRFPEFQNAEEWEEKPLGEIFDTMTGGTPERTVKGYWNGSIPWVTTSLVDFNTIYQAEEFITEAGLENSSAKLFPKGTILMALYGQGKTRGKVALLGIEATTNQACAAILPRDDFNLSFTFLNLCGRYDELRSLSNSGGQENLSQGLVRALPFRYPADPAEQQQIATCLSSLDELLAAQARKVEGLKAHKKGLMQQLFPSPEGLR